MKIGFLQLRPKFGEVKQNVKEAKSLLRNVSEATIIMPEFFNTGYLFRSKEELAELAESISTGYTVKEMKKIARQRSLNLIFGMAESLKKSFFNTAVLVTSKGKVYKYQKTHLFDREKLFFKSGSNSYSVYSVDEGKIGLMVCFDWIFPEVTRVLSLKGAQVICHPANLVLPYCQDAMRTRSIENRVFTITANRIGTEKRGNLSLTFTGKSQIVDPKGVVLASASEKTESLKIVEIDVSEANDKLVTPNNHIFNDRRTTLFRSITSKSSRS